MIMPLRRGQTLLLIGGIFLAGALTVAASAGSTPSRLASIGGIPFYKGQAGKVAVVAKGPYDNTLPVVIKNGTLKTVSEIKLSGTARVGGKLVATGQDQGVQPNVVPPGGLAIGYVYFHGAKIAASAKFTIAVSSTRPSQVQFENKVDIPVKSLRYVGGKVVGIGFNAGGKKISGPLSVYAACISSAKAVVALESDFADADDIAPKGQAPFTADFTSYGTAPAPKCRYVLVAMRGWTY